MTPQTMQVKWDDFFLRQFHTDEYNCLHFTSDVWHMLTGEDIKNKLITFLAANTERGPRIRAVKAFERLVDPVDPCLAVMQRPRMVPHVGVYVRGKIFHMHPSGVEYQPPNVAMRGFLTVSYYDAKRNVSA